MFDSLRLRFVRILFLEFLEISTVKFLRIFRLLLNFICWEYRSNSQVLYYTYYIIAYYKRIIVIVQSLTYRVDIQTLEIFIPIYGNSSLLLSRRSRIIVRAFCQAINLNRVWLLGTLRC